MSFSIDRDVLRTLFSKPVGIKNGLVRNPELIILIQDQE